MRPATATPLTPTDFYRCNRGGGPLSVLLSQRIASHLAALAHRRRFTPAALTVTNLALSLVGSGLLFIGTDYRILALLASVIWQLAYAFDCSDGQLARATRTTSASGGRLDVLCDFVGQSALLVVIAIVLDERTDLPPALLFGGVACWLFNLLLSVLSSEMSYASLTGGRRRTRIVARAIRDHAVVLALLGIGAIFIASPLLLAVIYVGYSALNASLLIVLLAREFGAAVQAARGQDSLRAASGE